MQKLTEIKESYTTQKRIRENGSVTTVPQNMTRFRSVPFVEGGARFGHFILDRIGLVLFSTVVGAGLGIVLVITHQTDFVQNSYFDLYERLFNWFILQPFYYFIFELGMQSTPGKVIMKRVVVDEYGNKPTTRQIFIRSIARTVPFEPFSCLNTLGWHDAWSKTFVIRKKDLEELRLLQKINTIDTSPSSTAATT